MYKKLSPIVVVVCALLLGGMIQAAELDVTAPMDTIRGVPNDGVTDGSRNFGWPVHQHPSLAIDNDTSSKYLHFKGEIESTGFQVTPSASRTIVVGLTFTTANDFPARDPIAFELSGSNDSIDGPYELIASDYIVDFAQAEAWPRFTKNETPVFFDNDVTYDHYQVLFTAVRNPGSANSIQISEVELLGKDLTAANPDPFDGAVIRDTWVNLNWMSRDSAYSHDVYFGENFAEVYRSTGGTFRGNQASNHFLIGADGYPYPDGLVPGTTYYWRIDEVEVDGVTKHRGDVWSFSVLYSKAYDPNPADGAATVVVIPKDGDWSSSINALKPGEIGQLEVGCYLGRKTITASGTPDKPIIIRGAGRLESIFDGESGNWALRLDNCSNLIIENITVTNPSPIGIDGRVNYSSLARNRLPESDPGYSTLAEGMIIRGGGSRITIRRSYFVDIATRGLFVGTGGVDDLSVEHNIFIRVSDDTAGGDVAAGSSATRMTVRENLMAGNVDGIVTAGVGAGHIFERNLIIFHRWEDGIDVKYTWKRKDEDPWTIIRNNVIYSHLSRYSGVTIQMGSDNVRVCGNVFHGTGGTETILIRGRNGSDGIVGNVKNHEIVGNWFDLKPGNNGRGIAFRIHRYTADPSDISNVYILHNVFTGGHKLGGITHGSNLNVYNNIFESTTFG
ncbi:MAG: right-handed parallel beta-helix repeat-containing protein, partial [Planctomycetota bacterium]